MVGAILADESLLLPVCVRLEGQYGIEGVHMTVPAVLGAGGVKSVPMLDLEPAELTALQSSAAQIAGQIAALEALGA
jgi:malate/lactate dehydrogenase